MSKIHRERVIDMSTMAKTIPVVAMMTLALLATVSPSLAGRYRTPTPQQAQFYEDLKSGKRPVSRKLLPLARRRALEAAPKSAVAPSAIAVATETTMQSTAVYISAHADDFVLFMNPYRDVVRSDTRTVFVFLTAGDAGLGKGPKSAPYYLARENGAIRAIRFMADATASTTADPRSGTVRVAGHYIQRWSYRDTTAYFLRLPDGAVEGVGYPIHDYASLMKLKTGEIGSIRAVDGSTTYKSWNDLVQTVAEIVRTQAAGTPNVWLDTHEIDVAANVGDHSDHLATGFAMAGVQTALPCVNLAHHVGYASSGLVNLDLDDIENRAAAFGNYASGMAERGYPGMTWEPGHKSWLAGMVTRLVGGNGNSCSF
jgi:hypothetical protein